MKYNKAERIKSSFGLFFIIFNVTHPILVKKKVKRTKRKSPDEERQLWLFSEKSLYFERKALYFTPRDQARNKILEIKNLLFSNALNWIRK